MDNSLAMHIRLAKKGDAHTIATIHVASWQKIYRNYIPDRVLDKLSVKEREQKWHELISNHVRILVIEQDNLMVGFASLCPSRDAGLDSNICGEISAIYLHPNVWHQGLGKKLCNKALSELEKMGFSEVVLWVLKENNQARKFYESMGFSETRQSKIELYDKNVNLQEIQYIKKLPTLFIFKPLQESDLDLLCTWFDKPHVKAWWNDSLTHEGIKEKYRDRIDDETVVPFIVYLDDKPIGFIQYSYVNKNGDGWWPDEAQGTVGIDQFIGEENFINRGYGTKMICAFSKKLFKNTAIKKIITDVDSNNRRAICCYEKVGFKFVKELMTTDGFAYLMEFKRKLLRK